MAELCGNSALLVKVKPGSLEQATRELRESKEVKDVHKVLGQWDLVVTAAFPNYEGLRSFVEKVDSKPYCEKCSTYPNFKDWTRTTTPTTPKTPTTGWALIRTTKVDELFNNLQKADEVQWLMSTSGEHNVIAKIGTQRLNDLSKFLTTRIHKVPGVRSTETMPSAEEQ